ncbi:hypothetical protein E6D60_14405 [Escherichia coli]|nr:hypothetical protein [Escherichia coli]EFC4191641.1 hypothetical protein [Escherichia coli]
MNPRPKFLHTIITIIKTYNYQIKQLISLNLCLVVLGVFNALPPKCRHLRVQCMFDFLMFE